MIRGLVQGVGFRPFVYRTAARHGLKGEVNNRTDGVAVIVQGDPAKVGDFRNDLLSHAPPAADIKSIEVYPRLLQEFDSFSITLSLNIDDQITEVSPDIAVCPDCLSEMDHDPRRMDYPFINCTNCGPRFSIIESLPYDRSHTSMKPFRMCPGCQSEYNDISDRRFHAQPVACDLCGPRYTYSDGVKILYDLKSILRETAALVQAGKIVAIKGTGGYHLLCDALNEDAVRTLRKKKQREARPFAVMFRNYDSLREYCHAGREESAELTSWRRPIMILKQKKQLAPSVSNGLNTTGAMLPYMPVHYQLFRMLATPVIVLTSGNISDEPIITDDVTAEAELGKIADALICYNRKIINRCDDSVVRIIDNKTALIRRSRGYVPRPVDLQLDAGNILALGAEQKNTFCLGKGKQAILSQYIGDIRNLAAYEFMNEALARFSQLFRFTPEAIACDLHPDYLSTRLAIEMSQEFRIPLFRIQHHHAHIASCMAEHKLDEPVIGISFDGTGYGTDGTIWGGEFLIADLMDFTRYTYLDPVALPGGDAAVREPWKTAFSYMYKYFGSSFDFMSVKVFKQAGREKLELLAEMLDKNINSPLSSGAGRLFDAVSALLGLCSVETFDSEAPLRLESAINENADEYYPFAAGRPVVFREMFTSILDDIRSGNTSVIPVKFHNTLAMVILEVAEQMSRDTSIKKVVLSGGCFQNKYLLEKACNLLREKSFNVYTNNRVPSNDGGVSLGQVVIASKRLK
ncbi:MAG: carbamoyltransferase HypF [Bacteroidales bacterium]|nr:carbamoyltransferase HypF [Bacteroidales bacterium]